MCARQDERGGGEHARRREAVQRVDADAHPALAQLLQRREAIGADLPRHAPVSHRCCRRRVMMSSPRNVSQPTAAAAVTSSHIVSQRQKRVESLENSSGLHLHVHNCCLNVSSSDSDYPR